jgi:vesicle-associated membrane protein 7
MPILYALVSRQDTVLAEYTTSKGNFHLVTMTLLKKIPAKDGRTSYVYDEHVFHSIVEQGITYLCMTDKAFPSNNAFRFLATSKDSFISTYGLDRVRAALAYQMDAEFKRTLQRHMEDTNKNSTSKLGLAQDKIDEVKQVMVKNIETIMQNEEKIEILVEKSEQLDNNAFKFQRSARNVNRRMWWKNMKLTIIAVLVVIVLIYALVAAFCGGLALQGCSANN